MSIVRSADAVTRGAEAPRQQFAQQFCALYAAAGCPPLRSLAAIAQRRAQAGQARDGSVSVTAQRISDWKAGRNVPARFDTLRPVLLELIISARRRGGETDVVMNVHVWRQLWERARTIRNRPKRGVVQRPSPDAETSSSADSTYFSGRHGAIRMLTDMVGEAMAGPRETRILVLTGASGVGKSSLLAAGLTPALEMKQPQPVTVQLVTPDHDPVNVLTAILVELGLRQESERESVAEERIGACSTDVVVVDQFEEVFAKVVSSAARDRIVALLGELAEVAVVLISLCSSHIPNCYAYPLLADSVERRRYHLEPMTTAELRAVIEAGMRGRDRRSDSGLEEALIASVCGIRRAPGRFGHEPAELPILSRTVQSIASNRTGTRNDIDSFRRIGGTEGVVHAIAENLWAALSSEQRDDLKRVLLLMVTLHADVGCIRRRIPHQEFDRLLGDDIQSAGLLRALIDARLVTAGQFEVYLSHDLVLTWDRLREWVDAASPAWLTNRKHCETDRGRDTLSPWQYVATNPRWFR